VASSRGQPDCWKPYASYLGKVKLNLDCWIFYQEGYVNIDRNREVRADRYEDISTLPASPMRFTPDTWLSMWTTSKRVSGVGLRY
jgi:hypothetical protein